MGEFVNEGFAGTHPKDACVPPEGNSTIEEDWGRRGHAILQVALSKGCAEPRDHCGR
jgi:hypothetical protein